MSAVDAASLPHVIDPAVVSGMGDKLTDIANRVTASFSGAHDRWHELRGIFDVRGAEGIHSMLERPNADASDFATALHTARNVLWDAASLTLPSLRTRRDELAARIVSVNAEADAAETAYATADAAYWSRWRVDPDASSTADARIDRAAADRDRSAAADAADALRDDIARFRADVEDAEDMIAAQLNGIADGTGVHGAWGEPVRVSQAFWGFANAPYPGAPASLTSPLNLAEHLEAALSDGVADRIRWLGGSSADDVEAWIAAHPDFASAVGFVAPGRAAQLWTSLAADSTPGRTEGGIPVEWLGGPLAQMFALAPLAVGNLNGVPAAQRDLFAQEGLAQLLGDDELDDDTRDKLLSLSRLLSRDDDAVLLSVFLDSDGAPRASVAWGDVDTADQITTMSHGIQTDLGQLGDWGGSAQDLRAALDKQLDFTGVAADTAVVLFMEWDSGDAWTVQGIERPDAGAARLAQLLGGFAQTNQAAQRNLVLHSLGTTMGGQMIADNDGLVDNVWFFGSAGVTADAGTAIAGQIDAGSLIVRATHSSSDWIAPLGRTDLLSEHPVDPRTVGGVMEFGSDGGYVDGIAPSGAQGDPTEGHNAQQSDEILYWGIDGWSTTPDGYPVPQYDTESTGYLDPTAQSFLQLVVDLAQEAQTVEVR